MSIGPIASEDALLLEQHSIVQATSNALTLHRLLLVFVVVSEQC